MKDKLARENIARLEKSTGGLLESRERLISNIYTLEEVIRLLADRMGLEMHIIREVDCPYISLTEKKGKK